MAWQSGGGGGIPGVTGNGHNGLTVQNALTAGDPAKTGVPDYHTLTGAVEFDDEPANGTDSDSVLSVNQTQANGPASFVPAALLVSRTGSIAASDYGGPTIDVRDFSGSGQPVVRIQTLAGIILELAGPRSITGVLSAVTDANAKAVLTSIIDALAHIRLASNDTT